MTIPFIRGSSWPRDQTQVSCIAGRFLTVWASRVAHPYIYIFIYIYQFNSAQSLSHVQLFVTPWTAAHQASLSFTIFWNLLKLMSIESAMPSTHLILCGSLLLLPSIFPSIRVLSNESALHIRWLKHWSFSISPSNEYSGLISFRIDWFDLLASQGTRKSLLQHHSSKAWILLHSAFFMDQLSHLYMTTGKIIALTIQTFIGKVMPPPFNMLFRFVITFLPRSKSLIIYINELVGFQNFKILFWNFPTIS